MLFRSMTSIKMTGVIYMLPIGYLFVFGPNFFEVWVPGQDTSFLQGMAVLSLIAMMPSCTSMLLNNVFIVSNKLKVPALVFLASGVLNVLIAVPLTLFTSCGIWSIIIVQGIIDIVKNAIIIPWYATYCIDINRRDLFITTIKSYSCVIPMVLVCLLYKRLLLVNSWPTLFISAGVCAVLAGMLCAFIMLNAEERNRVFNLFKTKPKTR